MAQTITSLSLTAADDVKILQQIATAVAETLGFKRFHARFCATAMSRFSMNGRLTARCWPGVPDAAMPP